MFFRMKHSKEIMQLKPVILVLMLISFCVRPAFLTEQYCGTNCTNTGRRVVCENCIPKAVPSNVKEVVLSKFNEVHLVPRVFCNVLWENVTKLVIESDRVTSVYHYYVLPDKTFDCLHKIESLKVSISSLNKLSTYAFFGLTNVRILDLTACNRLTVSVLSNAFSSDVVMPNLTTIILRNLGSFYRGIEITQEIIDVLARRNVSKIDLSYSKIKFIGATVNWEHLCKTLKILDLANSEFEYSSLPHSLILDDTVCTSLQVVNVSRIKTPGTPFYSNGNFSVSGINHTEKLHGFKFFSETSVIIANNIIPEKVHVYIYNSILNLFFNYSTNQVHLSGYSIPVFELELHIYPNYLKYLDISNNKIERLGPRIISYIKHLEKIDLSKNKIEKISITLFRSNHELKYINLAYNKITHIPLDIFKSNANLNNIKLLGNQIKEITFNFEHLLHLEIVDLRDNSIVLLDEWSRNQVDRLYYNKNHNNTQRTHTNETLSIDLRDNPFSCQCQSQEFINWFFISPVFDKTRDIYHCTIDGHQIPMNGKATEAVEDDCEKPEREKRKLLLSVLLPALSIGLTGIIIFKVFKTYRRRKIQRRIEDQVELLQEGTQEFRFPVFLSFSSEDIEFVLPHIHQPLLASYIYLKFVFRITNRS